MQEAYLAIQCRTNTGELGSFIYVEDEQGGMQAISPVGDLLVVFAWAKANHWIPDWHDPDHPVGTYRKED